MRGSGGGGGLRRTKEKVGEDRFPCVMLTCIGVDVCVFMCFYYNREPAVYARKFAFQQAF